MSDYDREREAQELASSFCHCSTAPCAACRRTADDVLARAEAHGRALVLELALSGLPDSETAGPDGAGYKYAWDELDGAEQEWVKQLRARIRETQKANA